MKRLDRTRPNEAIDECVTACENVVRSAMAHREEILTTRGDRAGNRSFLTSLDCDELATITSHHLLHYTGDDPEITDAILGAMLAVAARTVHDAREATGLDGARDELVTSCLRLIELLDAFHDTVAHNPSLQ